MALAKIEFRPGVVTDDSPLSAEGGFVDASLVRFKAGRAQIIGGWDLVTADVFSGKCRGLFVWASGDSAARAALGTHTHLYALRSGTLFDITPSGLVAGLEHGIGGDGYGVGVYGGGAFGISTVTQFYPRTWSLDSWGNYLLASPRGGTLYEWQLDTGLDAVAVTNAPTNIGSMFVAPERIVVCCGAQPYGSVTFDPMLVRWSDQEDNTQWTPAAVNQSGEQPLAIGARIVRGLASRKQNLIWTDAALYSMSYLGDAGLVYGFELLGQNCGLVGPNAAAQKDGVAFWWSVVGEFKMYSGGAPVTIPCPVQRYIMDNVTWLQADKIYCSMNSAQDEVWWFYPDARDGVGNECSRYVAYNYVEQHWTVGELARTAWADAGILRHPIATDTAGGLYYHEYLTSAAGGAIDARLETAPIDLADGDQLMALLRAVPDIEDLTGGISVTLLTRAFPHGAESEIGPYSILTTTEKIDLRTTARQIALRLESSSTPSFWRLGALRLDVRATGAKR